MGHEHPEFNSFDEQINKRPIVPPLPIEYITMDQASELAGLSYRQIERVIKSGLIDSIQVGRTILTTSEAVTYYMENDPGRKHDPLKRFRGEQSFNP